MRSAALLVALGLPIPYASAQAPASVLTILHSFTGRNGDGSYPYGGLAIGNGGALFGTTLMGDGFSAGTVFELMPPAAPGGAWKETVLYTFSGSDGAYPYAAPTIGKTGGLFGTTDGGGVSSAGTAFELTPPSGPGGAWTETVLHSFSVDGDGTGPYAGLINGQGGVFYGATSGGGPLHGGTVFKLTPPSASGGAWTEKVLYSFTGQSGDGLYPNGVLTAGANGVLYGTTQHGGASNAGTVFKLTPPSGSGGAWTETVLYSFTGGNDGGQPLAGMALGKSGALYGTASTGGTSLKGVVFELKPPSGSGAWSQTVLRSFTGQNGDGASPYAGVVLGANGSLYGATFAGGNQDQGTVFALKPPAASGGAWTETVLHRFNGSQGDGTNPYAAPVLANGVLYGTTTVGGAAGFGAVFQLTP